jgi:hypothetical protein
MIIDYLKLIFPNMTPNDLQNESNKYLKKVKVNLYCKSTWETKEIYLLKKEPIGKERLQLMFLQAIYIEYKDLDDAEDATYM